MGASKCLLIFLTMIEHYYLIAIALNWLASLWKFAIIIWMHISLGGACQAFFLLACQLNYAGLSDRPNHLDRKVIAIVEFSSLRVRFQFSKLIWMHISLGGACQAFFLLACKLNYAGLSNHLDRKVKPILGFKGQVIFFRRKSPRKKSPRKKSPKKKSLQKKSLGGACQAFFLLACQLNYAGLSNRPTIQIVK